MGSNEPIPGSRVTRLAPSPTGALHLGNARTFLVNWAMARHNGWRIVLRIEDLDGPRVKRGADQQTVDLMKWLGMDWDEGPYWQSADIERYRKAMDVLVRAGRAYASDLSRTEVERFGADSGLSAPQEGSGEVRFPPELRPAIDEDVKARGFDDPTRTWRFVVETRLVRIDDRFAGSHVFDVGAIAGDFIVWTRQGVPAYQLAVVVDDARQSVNEVVRGDDLLDSAARQMMVSRTLGLGSEPTYTHLPLVRGTDGRRLAKRHGDTRLDQYRQRGVRAERIVGLVAWWCGASDQRVEMSAREFCERLSLDRMSRDCVTYGLEDERWLLEGV